MNTQNDLSRVLEKIAEIANASADDDYIYRGESKCHSKVCSGLYREYETGIKGTHFDIGHIQDKILKEATEYTDKTNELEILTELQHYGGKTNLIDFTTDYHVALFFACDGEREEPGRVILLPKQPKGAPKPYTVKKPPRTIRRAEMQKSLFVQARRGFVETYIVVDIPADLKVHMLHYLNKHHDISTKTIYNDLLGFIENQRIHKKWHEEFYKGLSYQEDKEYDKAIEHYTTAIELNPEFAKAYNSRSFVYRMKENFKAAIQDCNKLIELNLELVEAYTNRGLAYFDKGEVDKAIQDYDKVIDLDPDYAIAYNNRGAAYYQKGDFDNAIQNYNKAIDLDPDYVLLYNNRGAAYHRKGDFDNAIQNYNKAVKLNPEYSSPYCNRGEARLHLKEWEKAKADLIRAKNKGHDIVAVFHNDYESVADFEAKHGVQVPKDIAALLSGNGN